ncbi:MAG: LamG-like jellyroll fold domain-containing protein, partial [Gemmatimonadota bacterium]
MSAAQFLPFRQSVAPTTWSRAWPLQEERWSTVRVDVRATEFDDVRLWHGQGRVSEAPAPATRRTLPLRLSCDPNPARDVASIRYGADVRLGPPELALYDLVGQRLWSRRRRQAGKARSSGRLDPLDSQPPDPFIGQVHIPRAALSSRYAGPLSANAADRRPAALPLSLGLALLLAAASATAAPDAPAASGDPPNRVLELDGQGAFVELPVAAFEGLRDATLEAWVRWDDWAYFSQWFAYGTEETWRSLGLNHFSTAPILQFFVYPGRREDLHVIGVKADLPLGRWYHMAAVSGGEGMACYLNGTLLGRDPYLGSFADLGRGTQALLGRSTFEGSAAFRGALDEVRLWSVRRTGAQIRADMGRALRGDEPGLAGLWSFDAGDARDLSPAGRHGRLRDGARCEPAAFPGLLPDPRPAIVHGQVLDETGSPVADARVRLTGRTGQTLGAGTDTTGGFALVVLDPGAYAVEVLSEVAAIPPRTIIAAPGADLRLDLRPPPASLVARWSAEGDARDAIGDHHGALLGAVTFGPGVAGQAFVFGGEPGALVRVPNAPQLNPPGSFTLVAWVYPTTDGAMPIAGMWGDWGDWRSERAYDLRVEPGLRLRFGLADDRHQDDGSFHSFHSRPNALALDTWTLVAGVWDAAAGERRLYVNGVLLARRADPPAPVVRSRADFSIGALVRNALGQVTDTFAGRIDEVSLYDAALSEGEILRLYSAHARAHWPGEGNASDATRSGHTGVPVNGVTYAPGVVGQALAFDGADSYVEVDSRIGNYGPSDFTVEAWLWLDAPPTQPGPIVAKSNGDDDGLALVVDENSHLTARIAGRQGVLRLTGRRPVSPAVWHHVVLVRDGVDLRLYLDGEPDGVVSAPGNIVVESVSPLLLGGDSQTFSLSGRLDEIALRDRALSADEIQATYRFVYAAWRWGIWSTRLQAWGSVAVGLLALLTVGRFVSQRRSRRRHEAQLAEAERARQAADAASAAKSVFLTHVSHEIRTPLNAILGHAQVLRDRSSVSDADRRSLESICQHGGQLLQLLNEVLDLSKVEAGRLELQADDFDLGQLVDGLAALFELRCRQKGLQFRVEADAGLGAVRGDAGKLRQVLVNLLGNAVKFTDAGEVVLAVSRHGRDHVFEVRDTGPGIAPEQRETIFQPFQQGPQGLAAGGTGLGLAIARRHAELMGGRLELASAPGRGACFTFRVPLEETAVRTGRAGTPAAPGAGAAAESFAGMALPAALRSRLREAAQMHNVTEVKLCLEQLQGLGERE